MRHGNSIIFVIIVVIIFQNIIYTPYSVKSDPEEFLSKKIKLNVRVIAVCKAEKLGAVILGLENGTVLAIGKSVVKHLLTLNAKPLACDFAEKANKLIFAASDGTLILISISPSLSVTGKSKFTLLSSDEIVENIAVSQDAHFAVLRVIYEYKSREAEKLVFVDLSRRLIIAVRDAESTPSLTRIFYFKKLGNILLLQTLDTFCEFCEYTDNLIEAYNLTDLKRLYWKKIGLSLESAFESSKKLVLVKLLPENGKYKVLILNYISGEILFTFNIEEVPQQLLLLNKEILFIKNTNVNVYNLIGVNEKTLKIPSSSKICYGNNFLFLFAPALVRIYDNRLNEIYEAPIEYIPPPKPCYFCAAFPDMAMVVYHDRKTIYVISKLMQRIFEALILDEAGNPLPNSFIEIYDKNGSLIYTGKSNSNGKFFALINLSNTFDNMLKIKIAKEGFENKTLWIKPENETTSLKIVLEKSSRVFRLLIKVLDESKEPIKNALVSVYTLNEEFIDSSLSDQNGIVTFNLSKGQYKIRIKKQNFTERELLVDLSRNEPVVEHTVTLRQLKPNLIVVLPANNTFNHLVITGHDFEKKIENLTQNTYKVTLPKSGFYVVEAFAKCGSKKYELYVKQKETIVLDQIICSIKELNTSHSKLEELFNKIEQEIARYVIHLEDKDTPISGILTSYDKTLTLNLSSTNRVIILELFYTKCWGCEKLIPLINNLSKTYDAIAGGMVTIYQTDSDQDIEEYIITHNVQVPVFRDTIGLKEKAEVSVVPTIIVIVEGKIRLIGVGAKIDKSSMPSIAFNFQEIIETKSLPRISFIVGIIFVILLSIYGMVKEKYED